MQCIYIYAFTQALFTDTSSMVPRIVKMKGVYCLTKEKQHLVFTYRNNSSLFLLDRA